MMRIYSRGFRRYRRLISAALAIGVVWSAIAAPGQSVELNADRVVLNPNSGWGFEFPAISADHQRVALVDIRGADRYTVSLKILRVPSLELELDFPLDTRPCGNLAEREESEACIEEVLAKPNELLRTGEFTTMWPLYRDNMGDSIPDEIISYYHFRVLFDRVSKELTIAQAIGRGIDGALVGTEYQSGEIYLQQRWRKQASKGLNHNGDPCSGMPVPLAAWINPDWKNAPAKGYLGSGCLYHDRRLRLP